MYAAGADGTPLGGAAAQRRLLALLAILAVAGRAGVSRDRILALLWPEGDPDRARHALTQSLYHARRNLRADDLIVPAGGDLRLNPDRITSDLEELEEGARAGDHARVAAAYQGPFLDGFFLAGSAEFERWASEQRDRLARVAAGSLDALASAAESRNAFAEAAQWRRRRVAIDPLDTQATLRLLGTLSAAGDRTGALQHARVYEALVRDELDVAPDPAVTAAVARIRREMEEGPAPLPTHAGPADIPAAEERHQVTVEGVPATAPAPVPSPAPAPVQPERPAPARGPVMPVAGDPPPLPVHHGHRARWILGVFLLTLFGVAVGWRMRHPSNGTPTLRSLEQPILVAPFRIAGASEELNYLRDGMVELLSMRLADDSSEHAIDPAAVLRAWADAGLGTLADVPRDSALSVAARLGAGHLVLGSVVGNPTRVVLSATLIDVRTRRSVAEGSVEGSTDSLATLVDGLAARLLASEAGEADRLGARATASVQALRAYLEGRAAEEQGEYLPASRAFERAVEIDSTFTVAAFHLALVADRLNNAEQHDRGLALAWAKREELTARDEAHLVAFAGPRYPDPSPAVEQLAAWERAVSLAPDRADVWLELGERFFYEGAVLGVDSAVARARQAFGRALELSPGNARARRYLVLSAARMHDHAALATLASRAALRDSLGPLSPFVRWRVALELGDERELAAVRAVLPRLDDANLRAIAMSAQYEPRTAGAMSDARRAMEIRVRRAQRRSELLDALLAEHSAALNSGRVARALALTEQIGDLQPGARAHLRLRVLDALYGGGDTVAARQAAVQLAVTAGGELAADSRVREIQLADACVLAQWRIAHGELGGVKAMIAQQADAGMTREMVPVGAAPGACAALLEAQLAVAAERKDAMKKVQQVDSLMLSGPAVSDAGSYAPLLVSRLYEALGERRKALTAVRRRPFMTGWPRYEVAHLAQEARMAAAVGETEIARRVRAELLVWRRP